MAHRPCQVLRSIQNRFPSGSLAVRSSARCEDGGDQSMAGAFQSVLHIPAQNTSQLGQAIENVISVFRDERDQVLVQPMVGKVAMCGVAMTRALEDGSPYYVLNYDDVSGRTDTVTGGQGVSKTVCIYKGVKDEHFDSPRLRRVLDMLRGLERHYGETPLDVEFVVDSADNVHLLQVRRSAPLSVGAPTRVRASLAASATWKPTSTRLCAPGRKFLVDGLCSALCRTGTLRKSSA